MSDSPRQRTGVDDAVLRVTIELLSTMSFARLSMELVAKRAAVGKPTVYRRWPSKAALVADAVARFAPTPHFDPEGDAAESARRGLVSFACAMVESGIAHVLYSLLGEAMSDADLAETLRARYFRPRQQVIEAALRRCVAAGALPPDLDLSSAISLLLGPLLHGWIVRGTRLDERQMTELVTLVWAALATAAEVGDAVGTDISGGQSSR
jgi:AcrR family transcriptional regulator